MEDLRTTPAPAQHPLCLALVAALSLGLGASGCQFAVDGIDPLGDDAPAGSDESLPADALAADAAAPSDGAPLDAPPLLDAPVDGALPDLAGSDGPAIADLLAPVDGPAADLAVAVDLLPARDLATPPPDLVPSVDLFSCTSDGDCGGATPRCYVPAGRCVPCLTTNDNCATGSYCVDAGGGSLSCQPGCKSDVECMASGTTTSACCSHACVDTATDVNNCGGCAMGCATPTHAATVKCAARKCAVATCSGTYGDCNGTFSDGCEVDLSSSAAHCGSCSNSCSSGICGKQIAASFTTDPSSSWSFNGSASYNSTFAEGILTVIGATNTAGTITYKNGIVTDVFDATFDIFLGGGGGADGMGFFIAADGATAVGSSGGGLGMGGFTGYGVEFDTYNNMVCGDTTSNHIAIDTLDTCMGGVEHQTVNNSPGTFRDFAWHTVTVHFDQGTWTVSLDGATVINNFSSPNFPMGQTYWYGFAGGTGGHTDYHVVRKVTVTFPTARCL